MHGVVFLCRGGPGGGCRDSRSHNTGFPLLFSDAAKSARRLAVLTGLAAVLGLTACAPPPPPVALPQNDPYEAANRRTHGFNQALDRNLVAPLAKGGGGLFDSPLGVGIGNVAANLSLPGEIVNKTLQGRFADAVHNGWRLVLNTTIGLGGLFDPAGAMGLDARGTDFGETLHVWGAGEGAFVMLPVVGPSTERDTLGMVVDVLIDPLGAALPVRERNWSRGIKYTAKLVDRARFSGTVDSILHESADSYAQLRLMYLQKRRFELGQESSDDAFIDPYDDPYGD